MQSHYWKILGIFILYECDFLHKAIIDYKNLSNLSYGIEHSKIFRLWLFLSRVKTQLQFTKKLLHNFYLHFLYRIHNALNTVYRFPNDTQKYNLDYYFELLMLAQPHKIRVLGLKKALKEKNSTRCFKCNAHNRTFTNHVKMAH